MRPVASSVACLLLLLTTAACTAGTSTAEPVTSARAGPSSAVSLSRHAKPRPRLILPAVGAAGFPVTIYPPPQSRKAVNTVGRCPSPAGLQPPQPGIRAAAQAVVHRLGHTFRSDLHLTDRVYWQQTLIDWREGLAQPSAQVSAKARRSVRVLYSGPLQSYHQAFGAPDLSRLIRTGCGRRTTRDTWMIVMGQVKEPALQGEFLLLIRRGHVLVWNTQ